ncbi:hypothetical protein M3J09_002400 [Ascochyta lentis]
MCEFLNNVFVLLEDLTSWIQDESIAWDHLSCSRGKTDHWYCKLNGLDGTRPCYTTEK